jgi:hypothetical protein
VYCRVRAHVCIVERAHVCGRVRARVCILERADVCCGGRERVYILVAESENVYGT